MDGGAAGAWWAAVYGVAQSWTQLKRLSSSILPLNAVEKLNDVKKSSWDTVK